MSIEKHSLKEGDVITVDGVAGFVDSIDTTWAGVLRVFVNSGGITSLIHEEEKIEFVPEDLKEPVLEGLKLMENETQQSLANLTERLGRLFESF